MIGIFDSGIFGLSLAAYLNNLLPEETILFFGDTAACPIGSGPDSQIHDHAQSGCQFLLEKGATSIILACHTSSSVAGKALRKEYAIPVIDMVEPVCRAAAKIGGCRSIGIMGSHATIRSNAYQETLAELCPSYKIFAASAPLLIPIIEEGLENKRESIMFLKRYLRPFKNNQIDMLIPACSHFQVLHRLILPRLGRKMRLFDPYREAAEIIARSYQSETMPRSTAVTASSNVTCFINHKTDLHVNISKTLFKSAVQVIKI